MHNCFSRCSVIRIKRDLWIKNLMEHHSRDDRELSSKEAWKKERSAIQKHSNSETLKQKKDWTCLQYEELNYSHQLLSGKSALSATEQTDVKVYLRDYKIVFEKKLERSSINKAPNKYAILQFCTWTAMAWLRLSRAGSSPSSSLSSSSSLHCAGKQKYIDLYFKCLVWKSCLSEVLIWK